MDVEFLEGPITLTHSPSNKSNVLNANDKNRRLYSFESYHGSKSYEESMLSNHKEIIQDWDINSNGMEGGDFFLDKSTIWLLQQSSFLDTYAENIRNTDNLTVYSSVLDASTIIEDEDPDMLKHALKFPDRKKMKKKKQNEVQPHDVVLVGLAKQSFSLTYDDMSKKVSPYIEHLTSSLAARPQTTSSVTSQSAQRFALIGPNPFLQNNNYMEDDILAEIKPFKKMKGKDQQWRMDTQFINEGNSLINTIVNPSFLNIQSNFSNSIANAKSDPLYKILLQQVKNVRKSTYYYNKRQVALPPLRNTTYSPKKKNRERRKLTFEISSGELALLGSFHKLPSAVWASTKLVYFIILCYANVIPNVDFPASWEFIHLQSVENFNNEFSWLDMQTLLKQPALFSNVLDVIEHGNNSKGIDRFTFYDSFPIDYMDALRIIADSKLLNEEILIHILPIAAKLCFWAKRVISSIYASMLFREPNYFAKVYNINLLIILS